MKKWNTVIATLALVALPVLAWVGLVSAQQFSATVGEGEVVDSTLYSSGQNVDIRGTINGDVFCAGQTVRINATVNGDILCAGQTVDIKGQVNGNIRVAAQTVTVDAQVKRNLTAAGQSIVLESAAIIGGDATATAAAVDLKGKIGRDAVLAGADVTLAGNIGRNVDATIESLVINTGARVGGNLVYQSESEASIPPGVNIVGEITREQVEQKETQPVWTAGLGIYLYFLAAMLLIGLVLVLFLPQAVRKTGDIAHKHFGKTILTGFVAGVVLPVVIFALGVTFVGLPLALITLLLWFILAMLSVPIAGYFVGKVLFKKLKHSVVVMLLGTTIVMSLCFLPFVGFIFFFATYWVGSGALLLGIKSHMPKPVYKA